MASNSGRKSGSSGRSGPRKRVVIGAGETVRVRYHDKEPQVESQRRSTRATEREGRCEAPGARALRGIEAWPAALGGEARRTRAQAATAFACADGARSRWSSQSWQSVVWGVGALLRAPIFTRRERRGRRSGAISRASADTPGGCDSAGCDAAETARCRDRASVGAQRVGCRCTGVA